MVEMCEWRTNKTGTAGSIAGDPLPTKLEAGASCKASFYFDGLLILLSLGGGTQGKRGRRISAIIHLGSGERVRSKPLDIPSQAMGYSYSLPGASNRTSS